MWPADLISGPVVKPHFARSGPFGRCWGCNDDHGSQGWSGRGFSEAAGVVQETNIQTGNDNGMS